MAERRSGADPVPSPAIRGGGALPGGLQVGDSGTPGRIRGRIIYLPDDLFERILVQAHRHDRTISEYVAGILERQVPDHRVARAEPAGDAGEAGAA